MGTRGTNVMRPASDAAEASDSPIAAVCWLRRDLRLSDNGALAAALDHARARRGRVLVVFVFDTDILGALPDRDDRRVGFLAQAVASLDAVLRKDGGGVLVLYGTGRTEIPRLVAEIGAVPVFASGDHEPFGIERDRVVSRELERSGSKLVVGLDHELFDPDLLRNGSGAPYRVFTPFFRAWRIALERDPACLDPRDSVPRAGEIARPAQPSMDASGWLERIGFSWASVRGPEGSEAAARRRLEAFLERIDTYGEARDFPLLDATSRLSVDLRFGTLSFREAVRQARGREGESAAKWLSELAWRDFYQAVLHHFPASIEYAFQTRLERVAWDDPLTNSVVAARWEAWTEGKTGFPFVDAAMRELRQTGWMHNRCRMVVASFLTKDIHIHWKRGERWFARWLVDIELASNVGGWQWAASTGADGQPWFRVFNPVEQGRSWDPDGTWIRRWCPEIAALPDKWIHSPWAASSDILREAGIELGRDWPRPIVDHAAERLEALDRFGRTSGRV